MAQANPIRVLVVDDSVVVRRLLSDVLSADPDIEVVGHAVNGRLALEKVEQLRPDVISMDIEMPEMDGVTAVRELRARRCRVRIIMFSTLTDSGAAATLDALAAGADDYVTKPANAGSVTESMQSVRAQLIPKIKALTGRETSAAAASALRPPVPAGTRSAVPAWPAPRPVPATSRDGAPSTGAAPSRLPIGGGRTPAVLVIGSSTGGPEALTKLLPALPATLPVPVLVVQHMPPVFTRQLAARLDRISPLTVVEAGDGDELRPGLVHLAPGDFHLRVRRMGAGHRAALDQGAPENFCRPAVDVLFRSAAEAYAGAVLAVVLTGMGADGRQGAACIRAGGGAVLAQDKASSVVWGMPGAVTQAGLADEVLPLGSIADAVRRRLPVGRSTATGSAAGRPFGTGTGTARLSAGAR